MKKINLLVYLLITAGFFSSNAIADEEINYSFSVKNWNNKIKMDNGDGSANVTTQAANGPIIGFTAKIGRAHV